MEFHLTPARVRQTADGPRFRIKNLKARDAAGARDITHLLDRTYDYASPRELRWHLADRFGIAPADVRIAS